MKSAKNTFIFIMSFIKCKIIDGKENATNQKTNFIEPTNNNWDCIRTHFSFLTKWFSFSAHSSYQAEKLPQPRFVYDLNGLLPTNIWHKWINRIDWRRLAADINVRKRLLRVDHISTTKLNREEFHAKNRCPSDW